MLEYKRSSLMYFIGFLHTTLLFFFYFMHYSKNISNGTTHLSCLTNFFMDFTMPHPIFYSILF